MFGSTTSQLKREWACLAHKSMKLLFFFLQSLVCCLCIISFGLTLKIYHIDTSSIDYVIGLVVPYLEFVVLVRTFVNISAFK